MMNKLTQALEPDYSVVRSMELDDASTITHLRASKEVLPNILIWIDEDGFTVYANEDPEKIEEVFFSGVFEELKIHEVKSFIHFNDKDGLLKWDNPIWLPLSARLFQAWIKE